ncbi:MAG: dihydropteroate synthase, partial [Alphaproteobacteria bacterium]
RLAGGGRAFTHCRAVIRSGSHELAHAVVPVAEVEAWAAGFAPDLAARAKALMTHLGAARPPFAGLTLDRPRLMAIINVTPDSFSDGGDRFDPDRAIADGLAMREAGADILDVGGESTRPGAAPVAPEEELRRTIPVVRALAEAGALVSIDTRRARVMAAAIEAGARIVNDVTALAGDPDSLRVVAESGVSVVLMHMQGEPRTMQADPTYADAALDVYDALAARVAACREAGIEPARIAVDPGIGFGKTVAHNLEILRALALYHGLGCALLLGVSRKSFIARLAYDEPPKQRFPGSLAAALAGLARGVQILRVHDVAWTRQALAVWQTIETAVSS